MKNTLKIRLYLLGVYLFWLGIILIVSYLLILGIGYTKKLKNTSEIQTNSNQQTKTELTICIYLDDTYYTSKLNEFLTVYKNIEHINFVYIKDVHDLTTEQKNCTAIIYNSSLNIPQKIKNSGNFKNESIFTIYTKYLIDDLNNYQNKFKNPIDFIDNLDKKTKDSLLISFNQENFKDIKPVFDDLQCFLEENSNRNKIQIISIFHHYPTGSKEWFNKIYKFTPTQKDIIKHSNIQIYTLNHALTSRCSQKSDSNWLCGFYKSINPFLDFDAVFLYSRHTFDYDYNDFVSTIQYLKKHQAILGARLSLKDPAIATIKDVKFSGINIESKRFCVNDGDYPAGLNCNTNKLGDINLIYSKNYDNKTIQKIINSDDPKNHVDIFFIDDNIKTKQGEKYLILNADKTYTILIYILNNHLYILV